jgi:hypothetical protein
MKFLSTSVIRKCALFRTSHPQLVLCVKHDSEFSFFVGNAHILKVACILKLYNVKLLSTTTKKLHGEQS